MEFDTESLLAQFPKMERRGGGFLAVKTISPKLAKAINVLDGRIDQIVPMFGELEIRIVAGRYR